MTPSALTFLTDEDRDALLARATLTHRLDGDVLLAASDASRALYWVVEGFALVQRTVGGVHLSVARLGPGEFFGEMSLIERAPTTAAVVADGPVQIARVGADDLNALADGVGGFEKRFYRSLAVVLSRRLRELGSFVASVDKQTEERHQDLFERLQPPEPSEHRALLAKVGDLRRRLSDSEFSVALGGDPTDVTERVFDEVVSLLRVRGPKAAGVLHRELFAAWMTSRTIAGSLLRIGGEACGPRTRELVLANEPDGDGPAGRALDRWFLNRAALVGMRQACASAARQMTGESVTLLGAVQGEVLRGATARFVQVNVLDRDEGTLLDVHGSVGGKKVLLAQMSIHELLRGRGRLTLEPADAVAGIGLLDRTSPSELTALLELCGRMLAREGVLWLSGTLPSDPEFALYRHLLGWAGHRYEPEQVEAAAGQAGLTVTVETYDVHALYALRWAADAT
ncbi:MAG: cyclic nucleotide-binding domain-containing protein [Proteobacteria bacterium]|nr:cyclic nucleotide-binding domain-containing protein [Pseudomonadota bacterium]